MIRVVRFAILKDMCNRNGLTVKEFLSNYNDTGKMPNVSSKDSKALLYTHEELASELQKFGNSVVDRLVPGWMVGLDSRFTDMKHNKHYHNFQLR